MWTYEIGCWMTQINDTNFAVLVMFKELEKLSGVGVNICELVVYNFIKTVYHNNLFN